MEEDRKFWSQRVQYVPTRLLTGGGTGAGTGTDDGFVQPCALAGDGVMGVGVDPGAATGSLPTGCDVVD